MKRRQKIVLVLHIEIRDNIGAIIIYGSSFKLDDGDGSEKYIDVCPLDDSVFYANQDKVEELKRELQKGSNIYNLSMRII